MLLRAPLGLLFGELLSPLLQLLGQVFVLVLQLLLLLAELGQLRLIPVALDKPIAQVFALASKGLVLLLDAVELGGKFRKLLLKCLHFTILLLELESQRLILRLILGAVIHELLHVRN